MGNRKITIQDNTTRQVESFMAKDKTIQGKKEQQISAILPSNVQLPGRAGLSVFAMYLCNIGLLPIIDRLFGTVRKNGKGLAVTEMFVQILSFFMDGTSRHLSWFDHLAADDAYAGLLGTGRQASSHAVKRFIGAISFCRIYLFCSTSHSASGISLVVACSLALAVRSSQSNTSWFRTSRLTKRRPGRKLYLTYLTPASIFTLLSGSLFRQRWTFRPRCNRYFLNASV
jgi:hypothetical protein